MTPAHGSLWTRPSTWVLLIANLVPVYGVLALGWDVFPIVLLFWLENVVIGLLNVFRMLLARPRDDEGCLKIFLVPFFCFHYGLFTMVHGVFVFALFGGDAFGRIGGPFELGGAVREAIGSWDLQVPLLVLTGSHVFSFLWNYLLEGEFRRTSAAQAMMQPYGRIVVLHVALLLGGFVTMALGSPVWALLLLIAMKIVLDLAGHAWAHRNDAEAPPIALPWRRPPRP